MKLSKHERKIIDLLLKNSRMTDKKIAKDLGITSQAVGKLRRKLEKSGILKSYNISVDLERIGIEAFALIHARLTQAGWDYKGGIGVQEKIASNPNIVGVYRVPEGQITHIILCAFRNLKELDRYIHILQSQYSDYLEIISTYVFSNSSIVKESYSDLIGKLMSERGEERMPEPTPFGRVVGEV